MVRGKARYYKNRPKAVPAPAPGFKELVGLELTMEDISPEEEKAIKQADIALYEIKQADIAFYEEAIKETLKTKLPSKLLEKALGDEIGEFLTASVSTPITETVVPTNTELTTSVVTPANDEQTTDGFGQPANNKRKKK